MYMNRYDFGKALALFGAVEEFGAQPIPAETIAAPAGREGRRSR
jgi:hypothetical protein